MRTALAALRDDPAYAATVTAVVATGVVLGVVEGYELRLGTQGLVTAALAVLLPVILVQRLVARR